jgi:hypothetical protein
MTAFAADSGTDVIIPWRPQPDRLNAFHRVIDWWVERGFTPILSDSDPDKPFNLSQARNNGVRASEAFVVILADADTIPDDLAMARAVRRARHEVVVYPFDDYIYLAATADPRDTSTPLDELPVERHFNHSFGGLMVVRRDIYWSLGGHDEKFEQWGYEDTAFQLAAEALFKTERVPGPVYAFNHSADRDMTARNPGRARVALYRYARRDPAIMRELLR